MKQKRARIIVAALIATPLFLIALYKLAPETMIDTTEPLPDFQQYQNVQEKKTAFFTYLEPIVITVNNAIRVDREKLKQILSHNKITKREQRWIQQLAAAYKLDMNSQNIHLELLKRVDEIPASLILAQAANESAWGTSRFAKTANNLFGEWCYSPGCGIIPNQRDAGKKHEVRAFHSIQASVESYVKAINTHSAYHDLRNLRLELRQSEQKVTGLELASGLLRYSERGISYVNEIKSMIRTNNLERYDC